MMSTEPNTEVYQSLASLRNISRQFVSTISIAKGAAQTLTSNLVGSGIVPRFQLKDSDLKKRLQDLFTQSASKMNFTEEKSSYYTDQYHVAHNVFANGEVFVRFVYREPNAKLPVLFQYQLLEAEYCDESYTEKITENKVIKVGKEFDRQNRLTAYHLFKDHPNDMYQTGDPYFRKRIPKKNVLHIGLAERLGQIRYKPFLTPILKKLFKIHGS